MGPWSAGDLHGDFKETSCPFAHKGERRKSMPLFCLLFYFWFWGELFALKEEPLRTPSPHFTDEETETLGLPWWSSG